MIDNDKIRIQEPIHTILRTTLLTTIQFSAADGARDTFLPADVGQGVYGYFDDFISFECF